MKLKNVLMIATAVMFFTTGSSAHAQTASAVLESYSRTEKRVTELDWNLLQFNLLWHDSYGDGEYVKSSPLFFDYQTMMFKANLRVANKRDYKDPEPFLSLPTSSQRAILQGVVDYLLKLLTQQFPKLDSMQSHVQVTFTYRQPGGGSSTVATYSNGQLKLLID